jgi:hypothetical protein
VLLGLSIHLAFWWAAFAWFWTRGFGWNLWSWLSPIAPIYLTYFFLRRGDWLWDIVAILAYAALLASIFLAVRKDRRRAVILAHLCLLLYWMVGFVLISTGV